jgi:hypothetical protein
VYATQLFSVPIELGSSHSPQLPREGLLGERAALQRAQGTGTRRISAAGAPETTFVKTRENRGSRSLPRLDKRLGRGGVESELLLFGDGAGRGRADSEGAAAQHLPEFQLERAEDRR